MRKYCKQPSHSVIRSFEETSERLTKAGVRTETLSGIFGPVMNAIGNISFVIVAAFGGWLAFKGVITVGKAAYTEDQMMEVAMEAGADDVIDDEDVWTLQTAMADFAAVRDALESAGVTMQSAELAMVPQNLVAVDAEAAQKVIRLMEALDDTDEELLTNNNMEALGDHDDVPNVYANADFPEDMDMD